MFDYTIIGTVLLLLGACGLCRSVFLNYDRKLQSYGEFLRLLYALRQKINTSALSPEQILESDEGYDLLVTSGYMSYAREKGLSAAFAEIEKTLVMDRDDKELLGKYFSEFGGDMLEAELEKLGIIIESLEAKHRQVKGDIPSQKKVASTVIVCCALMLIILIL